MSDTWDDVRAHVMEQKHERGTCDPPICHRCSEGECSMCHQPIELDSDGAEMDCCQRCWEFEVVGVDDVA